MSSRFHTFHLSSSFSLVQYFHPFANISFVRKYFILQLPRAHWLQRKNENLHYEIYVAHQTAGPPHRDERNNGTNSGCRMSFLKNGKCDERRRSVCALHEPSRRSEAKKEKGCAELMAFGHVFEASTTLWIWLHHIHSTALHWTSCISTNGNYPRREWRKKGRKKNCVPFWTLCKGIRCKPRQVIYCRQFPGVRCAPFFSSLSPALSPRGSSFVPKSKFIEPIERTARINFLID